MAQFIHPYVLKINADRTPCMLLLTDRFFSLLGELSVTSCTKINSGLIKRVECRKRNHENQEENIDGKLVRLLRYKCNEKNCKRKIDKFNCK